MFLQLLNRRFRPLKQLPWWVWPNKKTLRLHWSKMEGVLLLLLLGVFKVFFFFFLNLSWCLFSELMIQLQHVKIKAFDLPIYIINDLRKRKITSALVQFLAFLGLINNHIVHSFPLAPHPVRSTLTTSLYISEKGRGLPCALVVSVSAFPLGLIYCYPSKHQ